MDSEIVNLINQTPYLSPADKGFLVEQMKNIGHLDKLRLRGSLLSGQPPAILQSLQILRAKLYKEEHSPKPGILQKAVQAVVGKPKKRIFARSILTQPQILGGPAPQPVKGEKVPTLDTLDRIEHPAQLSQLTVKHVTFGLQVSSEQIVQTAFQRIDKIFRDMPDLNLKRSYFMCFVRSQLFGAYLNTAITALRHPELQPAKIILNLLNQINTQYLNNKQFQYTSVLSNHLRNVSGL